ncbi:MAG: DUF4259 domain-containing protein [Bacteroidota bacterium]
MGTWGPGSFDNDDALDWLAEFENATSTEPIIDALLTVVETAAYLEAPDAQVALAAAEVVAAMNRQAGDVPEEVTAWVEKQTRVPTIREVDLGRRATERVRTNSELLDLWTEADPSAWFEKVENLQSRLAR